MKKSLCCLGLAAFFAAPVQADVVEVTITGEVEFNGIPIPPLGDVPPGTPVTMTFLLDSNNFEDSMAFPTRGYAIDPMSYSLQLGGLEVNLADPPPPGDEDPFFVLRNDDPAVDGFFLATNVNFPNGIPLDEPALLDPFFRIQYSTTYTGDTLDSLDILDAQGTYDFTNLTVFNFVIQDGPVKPFGILFQQMTIASVAECFLVVGDEPGITAWNAPGGHTFFPQVQNVLDFHPVLMDDLAEFVIPAVDRPWSTTPLDWNDPTAPITFTVQVMMWNPEVFPQMPEQYTNGLRAFVLPDGTVHTRRFGDSLNMDITARVRRTFEGDLHVTFPFTIDGI